MKTTLFSVLLAAMLFAVRPAHAQSEDYGQEGIGRSQAVNEAPYALQETQSTSDDQVEFDHGPGHGGGGGGHGPGHGGGGGGWHGPGHGGGGGWHGPGHGGGGGWHGPGHGGGGGWHGPGHGGGGWGHGGWQGPRPGWHDGWHWDHRAWHPHWWYPGFIFPGFFWVGDIPVGYWQCTAFNQNREAFSDIAPDIDQAAYGALYECGGPDYQGNGCYVPEGYCQHHL